MQPPELFYFTDINAVQSPFCNTSVVLFTQLLMSLIMQLNRRELKELKKHKMICDFTELCVGAKTLKMLTCETPLQ